MKCNNFYSLFVRRHESENIYSSIYSKLFITVFLKCQIVDTKAQSRWFMDDIYHRNEECSLYSTLYPPVMATVCSGNDSKKMAGFYSSTDTY